MALTQDEIDIIVDPALDRLAAGSATFSPQTDVTTKAVLRHYDRTRKSTLRSFLWPWATKQGELIRVQTIELDADPGTPWEVGDTITGSTSGVTSTILSVTSTKIFVVAYATGDYTDDEELTNGVAAVDCGTGYPVQADDTPIFRWNYKYELPTDFIRIAAIQEIDDIDYIDERVQRQGHQILTDYGTINMEYIWDVTDPNEFEELFTELFILQLAVTLINPLAGSASDKFKQELRQDLKAARTRARMVCFQEDAPGGRNSWSNARWGGQNVR